MALDDELKRALAAEDPGEEFTARVLARVRRESGASVAGGVVAASAEEATATRGGGIDVVAPVNGTGRPGGSRILPMTPRGAATDRQAPAATPATPVTPSSVPSDVSLPDVTAPRRTRARWVWVATMAASLLVSAAGGAQWMRHRQELAEGERARAEVLAALRLTSEKLSLVRQAVANPGASADAASPEPR